ncbi:MAG: Crp/Fnr family transcriptional regulator [Eubacteriales bacterium]|nr:Crp/Fnr family transcriptional regulator [Eubacteriales bacterium]
MQKFDKILFLCPLFEGIEPNDLRAMTACLGAREVFVRKNEAIWSEGDAAQDVGILLGGGVQILRTDYYGSRSVMMQIAPGELFGETFACAGVPTVPVSALATEDSRILLINCQRLLTSCTNACAFHSRLIFNMLRIVAQKNLALHRRASINAHRTTRGKLMAYLLEEAKRAGSASFSIPFDRQALADYLEVDRSGLSAEIGKLSREGVLRCSKNEFTLLQPAQEAAQKR